MLPSLTNQPSAADIPHLLEVLRKEYLQYLDEAIAKRKEEGRPVQFESAQEALAGLPYAHFDMERSGAGMTWDAIHTDHDLHRERPWLVNYVEDRDLWRFKLPNSKEVNAYISSRKQTFEEWNKMITFWVYNKRTC